MDRLKILHNLLNEQIVLKKLMKRGYMKAYYPLINEYEMRGEKRFDPNQSNIGEKLDEEEREMKMLDAELFDETKEKGLIQAWKYWIRVPASKIRNYFGEKIAFYFAFLSLYANLYKYKFRYTRYLLFAGIVGIPLFIVQRLLNNEDDGNKIFSAIYCLIIILWATGLIEHWKRREG